MSKDNPILSENTRTSLGRSAQRNNILAAKLVAETVRTTLGPRGMDKLLVDSLGEVVVTNDGATILREMAIEHPTAKMIVEIAKTQESEVGDGTTSAVIIAGELLKQAEQLLDKNIHPTIIIKGYRLAMQKSLELLKTFAKDVKSSDKDILQRIAQTAITGKSAEYMSSTLSQLCVDAVQSVAHGSAQKNGSVNLENIRRQSVIGETDGTPELIRGLIIDKERVHPGMPTEIKNAKIALLNVPLEIRDTETDAKISITAPEQLEQYLMQEERMLHRMVESVIKSGANVVVTQKGVDDLAQHYLAKAGIYTIRRVKKSDISALCRATGGTLITKLDDLQADTLGKAEQVKQMKIGNEYMTLFSGCTSQEIVSILVQGSTPHVVAELVRSIDDALGDLSSALKDGKVVSGAGSPEIVVSKGLQDYASHLSGKEQLAVQAFAKSLEVIPITLAENGGLDPIDIVTELHAQHKAGKQLFGVNVLDGGVFDAWAAGVIEPLRVKTQAIQSATQVAIMILRIDDIIASAPMSEEKGPDLDEY